VTSINDTFSRPQKLWKEKARRIQPPPKSAVIDDPSTPRRDFGFGKIGQSREEIELKAQNVFNGVTEDREKLQQERDKWEAVKQAERKRQEEEKAHQERLLRHKHLEILKMQEIFFKMSVNGKIKMCDVPFLDREDVERIANSVDDPKKSVQWLSLRWHPDKFTQRFGMVLHETQSDEIMARVKETFQIIHEIRDSYQ